MTPAPQSEGSAGTKLRQTNGADTRSFTLKQRKTEHMKRKSIATTVRQGMGIDGGKAPRQVHPPSKLNRSDPWNPPVLSDGDEGLSVADKKAKHTSNEDAGLAPRQDAIRGERQLRRRGTSLTMSKPTSPTTAAVVAASSLVSRD